jgi:hypothetical protein
MITLSIYKKIRKQCGSIRNLHKSVKTLWQTIERELQLYAALKGEYQEERVSLNNF